jgi:excisionase family DNA binding protein
MVSFPSNLRAGIVLAGKKRKPAPKKLTPRSAWALLILLWGREAIMAEGTNEVLTTKEACQYLRISRPTYLKLIYTNQIKAKKVGKGWKAFKSELQAYLGKFETPRKGPSEPGRMEG